MSNATRAAAKEVRRATKGSLGKEVRATKGKGMSISTTPLPLRVRDPLSPDEETPRLGIVTELLGGRKVFPQQPTTQLAAHEMLVMGLPARSVESLVSHLSILGTADPSLAKALGISLRTVQRQKKTPNKRLSQEQSGRMWKFAEILAKATKGFGSQPDAEQWMRRPATGLEQRRPIELLETPAGTELVEDFLERIEYGVYT